MMSGITNDERPQGVWLIDNHNVSCHDSHTFGYDSALDTAAVYDGHDRQTFNN